MSTPPLLPSNYRYLEEISSGSVWKAINSDLNRCEAVKVHRPASKKWQILCHMLSKIEHENIARIYYVDAQGAYVIMEYLGGGSLASLLDEYDFPLFAGLEIVKQVVEGIHFAHTKGVIHRDLKPQNILFSHKMVPKITDFRITKAIDSDNPIATQNNLRTPQYMSPEQWENPEGIDHRSDIWSMGVILYQFLTKQTPFQNLSGIQLAKATVMEPIPLPGEVIPELSKLGQAAQRICMRALEKDREKRYQSAGLMAEEIADVIRQFSSSIFDVQLSAKSTPKPISLLENIRKSYGFLEADARFPCFNNKCKAPIGFKEICDQQAFFDRINRRYWCQNCFGQMKPVLGDYPIIGLDKRPTAVVCVVWDKENQNPLLLRKSIKESREMIERGRRVLAILSAVQSNRLMKLFAWAPLSSRISNDHYMIKYYLPGVYLSWLTGYSLRSDAKTKPFLGPCSYAETVYLLIETALALSVLHREGLVHRSISPSSIFVDCNGKVYLGNLILTKFSKQDWLLRTGQTLTQADTPLGILEYMAPEQIESALEVDQASDIWSVGVLGYYLMTGQIPFGGTTFFEKAMSIKRDQVQFPESLPKPFTAIICKCLQKNPQDRYLHVEELIRDLENLHG